MAQKATCSYTSSSSKPPNPSHSLPCWMGPGEVRTQRRKMCFWHHVPGQKPTIIAQGYIISQFTQLPSIETNTAFNPIPRTYVRPRPCTRYFYYINWATIDIFAKCYINTYRSSMLDATRYTALCLRGATALNYLQVYHIIRKLGLM